MIWFAIVLLAVAVLAPLGVALEKRANLRGVKEPTLALHRTQLLELDRDLAEGRILPSEHATAVLEVQRRLLSAADKPEDGARMGARWPVLAVMVFVPALAGGLYLATGTPGMPSVTPGSTQARQQRAMEEDLLVGQLRERLRAMDPKSNQAHEGFVLLGNVEFSRGNFAAAAQAWRTALDTKFDPTLAVRTVDAEIRVDSGLTPAGEALLRRALAAAPADAPWRAAVEDRLKQAKR